VKPEFRGKGYAKWIITQLALRQIKDTELDYHMSFVLDTNVVSSCVHKKSGYKEYTNDRYFWIMFEPLK
jgi:predicted GNAT family acetyltransferase